MEIYISSPPSPSHPLPPLRSRPLNQARGSGTALRLPQRGVGGAPVEIEFSAFKP